MGNCRKYRMTLCSYIIIGILLKVPSVQSHTQCDNGEIKQVNGVVGQSIILQTGRNGPTGARDQFFWSTLPDNYVLMSNTPGQLLNESQGTPSWICKLRERIHLDPVSGSLNITDLSLNDTGLYCGQVWKTTGSFHRFNVTILAAPVLTCEGGDIKEVIAKVGQKLLLPTGCPPVVHVYAKESKNPATIILHCLATGFYSKYGVTLDIKRNGRVLEELDGIQSTDVRPNSDGTYQNEKHVEILRSDSSKFSCEVKHAASNMHVATDWDPQHGADWNIHPALPWVIGVVLFLCLCLLAYFLIIKKRNIGEVNNQEGTQQVRGSGGRSGDQPEQPLLDEVVVGGEKQTGEPIQPPADAEEGSTESPSQVAGEGEATQ